MAERRMFHAAVVESDAFLDLPPAVQALYFHLGMAADDDGFVNGPKQVARKLGLAPTDLQQLMDTGFLLDFDGIVVLKHWRMANTMQNDRIKPLRYPDIAQNIYIKENRSYTATPFDGAQSLFLHRQDLLDSNRNPKGKEKKGTEKKRKEENRKENKVAVATDPAAAAKTALNYMQGTLGQGVVLLSEAQIEELLERMGLDSFDHYVRKLADFIINKNASVKNHYATISKWWEEDRRILQ